jgi:hypothetical protein
MQPKKKRRIPDGREPGESMVHNHVGCGKSAQRIKRVRDRRHSLAILKIKFVVSHSQRPQSGANLLQFSVQAARPAHVISGVRFFIRERRGLVFQKITERIESVFIAEAR